jgi:hypothetical protein
MSPNLPKPVLKVLLCSPRGFCAGVVRAIESVERALTLYGPPVYVRHEIVHNKYVVESLKNKGAIFVEDLTEVPPLAVTVFSAHGVARSVALRARKQTMARQSREKCAAPLAQAEPQDELSWQELQGVHRRQRIREPEWPEGLSRRRELQMIRVHRELPAMVRLRWKNLCPWRVPGSIAFLPFARFLHSCRS